MKPTILNLFGKEIRLARTDRQMMNELVAWAAPRLVDPMDSIKAHYKDFPPALQQLMVREAMHAKRMPKSIDHPEIQAMLTTPEGLEKMMTLHFKRYQPDLTIDEIFELHLEAIKVYGEKYAESDNPKTLAELEAEEKANEQPKTSGLTFEEALAQSKG